jgi:hypothetical protein
MIVLGFIDCVSLGFFGEVTEQTEITKHTEKINGFRLFRYFRLFRSLTSSLFVNYKEIVVEKIVFLSALESRIFHPAFQLI